jgi:cytochrome c553
MAPSRSVMGLHSRWSNAMKRNLLTIAVAGGLAIAGASIDIVADATAQGRGMGGGMGGMPGPVSQGNPVAGATTAAQTCFACHGADGNSTQAGFPNLAGQKESYLYAQLRNFASGARKNEIMHGMVAALDDRQMQDVAAHFSRQVRKTPPSKVPLSGAGRDLYLSGNQARQVPACVECHGDTPTRAWGANPPRLAGQPAVYLEAQLKALREGQRTEARMMPMVASRLSDADIRAVSAYLAGL